MIFLLLIPCPRPRHQEQENLGNVENYRAVAMVPVFFEPVDSLAYSGEAVASVVDGGLELSPVITAQSELAASASGLGSAAVATSAGAVSTSMGVPALPVLPTLDLGPAQIAGSATVTRASSPVAASAVGLSADVGPVDGGVLSAPKQRLASKLNRLITEYRAAAV